MYFGMVLLESVVRGELESMNSRNQGVTQLRFSTHNQDPAKDHPPNLHSFISGERAWGVKSAMGYGNLRVTGVGEAVSGLKRVTSMTALLALSKCTV